MELRTGMHRATSKRFKPFYMEEFGLPHVGTAISVLNWTSHYFPFLPSSPGQHAGDWHDLQLGSRCACTLLPPPHPPAETRNHRDPTAFSFYSVYSGILTILTT
jgi:hypothetical protein